MHTGPGLLLALWAAVPALALLTANETATSITLENDRIKFGLEKSSGYMTTVNLDGVNLLGERITSTNAIGPYLDGIFSADQKLVSVGSGGTYSVIQGTDTGGVKWAGVVITNDSPRGDTGEYTRHGMDREEKINGRPRRPAVLVPPRDRDVPARVHAPGVP